MLRIPRTLAVKLFDALNFQTAGKWTDGRVRGRLLSLDNFVAEDTQLENPKLQALLQAVFRALKKGTTIEVLSSDTPKSSPSPNKEGTNMDETAPKTKKKLTKKRPPVSDDTVVAEETAETPKATQKKVTKKVTKKAVVKKASMKEAPKKKAKKAVPVKKEKKAKKEPGQLSTKDRVYKMYLKVSPEKASSYIEKWFAQVNEAVQITTIRNWVSQWKKGKALPRCAN